MIGPGQSFFIKVDANTDITFDESYKLTNQSIGMFGKTAIANRLSVVLSDSLSSDEAIVYFDKGATKNIDTKYDAEKLGYTVGSIASFTLYDSTKLVFNGSKLFASNTSFDTIALQTYLGSSPKTYTLTLNGVNTFNNTQIFLADKFTQSRVNISNYNKYHFSVTSNPLSYTQTRFYLVFANTLQNLPVSLLELNAKLSSQHRVDLNWSTASELNNKGFDIEHSTNGIDYYAIGFVKGAGNAAYKNSYQYIHLQPSKGINYYRLKQIDFDNSFSYSDIVYVQTEDNITEEHVQIFPVPAKTHLTISSSHPFEEVNILDINGKTITHSKGNSLEVSQLPAGIYITEIIYTSGNITRHKFIKE
jgi:hypothetical protein